MGDNIVKNKSYKFAIRIVKLCKFLREDKKEFDIAKQILRSGTSIGANIEEANGAISKKNFIAKIHISLKETNETIFWLRLLCDSEILDEKISESLLADAKELQALLTAILKTTKINIVNENLKNNEKTSKI